MNKFHESTNIFPTITGDEFAALLGDIEKQGLQEPIILHPDGSILDGRARYQACQKLGIGPKFRTWRGRGSELNLVLSLNLRRRHLSASQRAALAVELLPRFEAEARERQRGGQGGKMLPGLIPEAKGEAREKVAHLTHVDPTYVSSAKRLSQEHPELFRSVRAGGLSLTDAKLRVKQDRREETIKLNRELKAGPLPRGKFQTIVIDPPWDYEGEGYKNRLVLKPPYPTLSMEEIAAFPVGKLAEPNAHLYLWTTGLFLRRSFALLDGWGFRFAAILVWVKQRSMIASYFNSTTEFILFGIRGSLPLLRDDACTHFVADRANKHSSKPEIFYELVESCSPGPWLQLFARPSKRPGWVLWGAEVGKVP